MEEPPDILLSLIKYTDSRGQEKEFRLIQKIQNKCKEVGTHLNIEESTLKSFEHNPKCPEPIDICNKILATWKERGEDNVTWAGLLQALDDAQLGGIARKLTEALDAYYRIHSN